MSAERQPVFNAPWPPLLLAAIIFLSFGFQEMLGGEAIKQYYAFSGQALAAGRWETLLTSLFLHGGWAHAATNGAFALAFGTPVSRYVGESLRGVSVFTLFYVTGGVISCLGFLLLHRENAAVIGASGAVSGLMGAAARLIAGRGVPGPYLSSPVIGMTTAWVGVNLLFAVVGFVPGLGEGVMAWEAHLVGYAAGLFLIGPFGRLAGWGHEEAPAGDH
ncbi:MAG: rhomboid family intramembrane serine protease [Phenylobacterium sp.]|nr:rhomboid family intramembrane serine protease [Phenylobacterium sp.]